MKIFFNGQPREVAERTTIADLIRELTLQPRYLAVEVNLTLIPRARHDEYVLQPQDRLEVVTLVGGG